MQKEKLRTVRKRKGYTQQQVADAIATDVSNYSRKESGSVKIIHSEWDKIAKFLDVPVEEIYEDDDTNIVVNNPVFNDSPGSSGAIGNNVNNFSNELSIEVIKNLQDYISLLKEEISKLKSEK
ncbi:transcriptional regulator [Chryseobacterium contaminans]|uniref:Helix-turn-helix domain-containing protein n=1 Tax=Chryseobacterium contaminans TaxID=1423959 RepID=A0A1M7C0T9_9FLAO|nr:helix-turn-helix transcriptional regulator [Chryseobacterium contaminans]OCA79898.1 transcriptional regulator [Chryseobacterium contaminans]SHL60459.1 Helix-turn-helix domain-containing protein [Chryseobacterium contaminans]